MTWLAEKPVFLIMIGLLTTALLGGLWIQTGRRPLLVALLTTICLTCLAVAIERLVVTDREQIEATLHQIADTVEQNDLPAVLSHIHSKALRIRQVAEAEFPQYDFDQVKIKPNLEIRVEPGEPKRAVAEFNVVVMGSRGELVKNRRVPRFVIVTFEQEGDDWRIVDYEHYDPQQGYMVRPPQR